MRARAVRERDWEEPAKLHLELAMELELGLWSLASVYRTTEPTTEVQLKPERYGTTDAPRRSHAAGPYILLLCAVYSCMPAVGLGHSIYHPRLIWGRWLTLLSALWQRLPKATSEIAGSCFLRPHQDGPQAPRDKYRSRRICILSESAGLSPSPTFILSRSPQKTTVGDDDGSWINYK